MQTKNLNKETSVNKHSIHLQPEQRHLLEELTHHGHASARSIVHAHILLKSEQGWKNKDIMKTFGVGATTIWRVRRRFLEQGLEAALNRRPHPERPEKRKVTGEAEARLIALACRTAPTGYEGWSIRLLTKTAIELEIVEHVGRETIRRILKKTS